MGTERTRTVNALTALVRSVDLGVDARRALTSAQVTTIAGWRSRGEAPELLKLPGVGPVVAGTILLAWSHPGRVRSEAAFAALAGASPIPASSGNTVRYRLN